MSKVFKALTIFLSVFFVLLFVISLIYSNEITEILKYEAEGYGLFGLFAGSFILELLPQYIAPQLFAFQGVLWGFSFLQVIFSLYLGSVLGSLIGFEIGKKYREKVLDEYVNQKTKNKIERGFRKYGIPGLFLSSITPLPYVPMLFAALLPLKRKTFILFGVIPRFFYFFYIAAISFYIF